MFFLIYFFLFGIIVGSFLNVVILRLPNEESLLGRSHCQNCKKMLSVFELVPIFGFLFLGGKCKNCKKKISWRYFLVELTTGVLFAFSWFYFQPQDFLGYLILAKVMFSTCLFLIIFIIDLEHFLILDSVIFFGIALTSVLNLALDIKLSLFFSVFGSNFLGGIFSAILMSAPFCALWYFSNEKALGFGDVKLALLLGIVFGWPLVFVNVFLAIMLGGLVSAWLLVFGGKNLKSHVPFGTFLSIAGICTLFWGEKFLVWYLAFLGL